MCMHAVCVSCTYISIYVCMHAGMLHRFKCLNICIYALVLIHRQTSGIPYLSVCGYVGGVCVCVCTCFCVRNTYFRKVANARGLGAGGTNVCLFAYMCEQYRSVL